MDSPSNPHQNHLLVALPAAEFEHIAPALELVVMHQGEVLYESGEQLQYVYFPTTAVVSLHYLTESGASAEIAGVGREGVLGIQIFMGGISTPSRAVACIGGNVYRLKASRLMREFQRAGGRRAAILPLLLLRYAQALLTQVSQMAVCNRHHSVEQQLCRWLLLNLDRVHSNELTLTQELIALMIGVRREGITKAAGHLQQAGFISHRRGHIIVLDRAGLESRVCECYAVIKNEFSRLRCETVHRHDHALAVQG